MKNPALAEFPSTLGQLFANLNATSGLNREEFKVLSGYFKVRNLEKKAYLTKPGEVDQYLNYIVSGLARKFLIAEKKEITLQLSPESHFIYAELSFHTGLPADCYIEAIEPLTMFSLHRDDLEKLLNEIPRLNKLFRLMVSEMYIRKDLRDQGMLRLSAKERFLQYVHKHPDMLQRVSQKYIASYLNINPETFSRLKHLIRQRR